MVMTDPIIDAGPVIGFAAIGFCFSLERLLSWRGVPHRDFLACESRIMPRLGQLINLVRTGMGMVTRFFVLCSDL